MRARSSSFCCSVERPGLLGQSILETTAIHAPRNSRGGEGGMSGEVLDAAVAKLAQKTISTKKRKPQNGRARPPGAPICVKGDRARWEVRDRGAPGGRAL